MEGGPGFIRDAGSPTWSWYRFCPPIMDLFLTVDTDEIQLWFPIVLLYLRFL